MPEAKYQYLRRIEKIFCVLSKLDLRVFLPLKLFSWIYFEININTKFIHLKNSMIITIYLTIKSFFKFSFNFKISFIDIKYPYLNRSRRFFKFIFKIKLYSNLEKSCNLSIHRFLKLISSYDPKFNFPKINSKLSLSWYRYYIY